MSTVTPPQPVAIIADDEELGRLLLAESVAATGLRPLAFDSGTAALEAALTHEPAIVLLDVDMPGMDGYAVCRRLRTEPRLANTPIVMVTGHEDSAAIGRAYDAGATDFVSKPVNWALLPHRLAYILRNAAAAGRIERLAYFDPLTGLPNRQRCIEIAERLCIEAAQSRDSVAMLYLDLNSFKRVNDTFGHAAGDAVLKTVAAKLMRALHGYQTTQEQVSLARFGGDEFVILVRHADARSVAMTIAAACCTEFREPIAHEGLEFYSAPSIGLAVYPEDGGDVATVLKHADTAMYQAKNGASSGVAVYSAAMSSHLRDWLDLEARLRRAVEEDLLHLQYQPKFRLRDNSIAGVEGLLRWHDTEYGDIAPGRFVEIAEDSGLIIDLTNWVVRAACQQLRRWQDRGIAVPVAINVSGKDLLHGDPARVVETEAAAAGVSPALIEIEITESLLVKNSATVRSGLEKLRQLGCRIALDDFGTGYSSLSYLKKLPVNAVKIDKSFVINMMTDQNDAQIVRSTIDLAHNLGLKVIAEGVETRDVWDRLKVLGCDEAQGYYMSRPLPASELTKWIQRENSVTASRILNSNGELVFEN